MGVITICDIDYGVIFGPFPSQGAKMDPTFLIGLLTRDKIPTEGQIQVSPSQTVGTTRAIEWLPYILPARNEEEQNMEAYMKNGKVFYRTLRIIKASEELLVWYSKDFCQLIDIPDVRRVTEHDVEKYVCKYCAEVFDHVFPLRAHLRFKCEGNGHNGTNNRLIGKYEEMKFFREKEPNVLDLTQNIKIVKEICDRKRENEDSDSFSKSKVFVFENTENECPRLEGKTLPQKDHNSNVQTMNEIKEYTSTSAFRKVAKPVSTIGTDVISISNLCQVNGPQNNHLYTPNQSKHAFESISQRVSIKPDNMIVTSSMSDSITCSSTIPYGHKIPSKDIYRTNGLYPVYGSVMRKIEGINIDSNTQTMLPERYNTGLPAPYTKSTNPMVEKILSGAAPTTINAPLHAMALSQNWCAKCNASFRMTSDLVYHMRSHHKREFDPVKKKRDDKLQCNICHETFRERHHLTRHMTSHA